MGKNFFKSNNNMYESKLVSGKKGKSTDDRDEEASTEREVIDNMSKACVIWLSAALRKPEIFRNWSSCTQLEKNQEGTNHGYINIYVNI